ncbi:MAG: DegT/DnrJ/EryC1/StrS family aminotransferase [Dehalococcoidales bacterium]|jgi:perosamine synthetase|nr:DegT/DnrJ/EryC1/StrS family aminotransferase [Dehalococcoidales bacterium]
MIPIAKPVIDQDTEETIRQVIVSGSLAQGRYVKEFEEAFASYISSEHAIATTSGTNALQLALLAAGIREGDEVITTPFSFIASATAVLQCGARPIFADIDPVTFNIDPNEIESKITPRTKAIIGVHLYGQVFNIEATQDICEHHNLVMIEDACQAHGASWREHKAGSFGIGCFSFYPTKNMTTGEGGMITTNDQDIACKCRLLRNHGQAERYRHTILGYNARMTEIAAVIGLSQLKRLDLFNEVRIKNAGFLTEVITSINGLVPPQVLKGSKHVFHQYTIRVTPNYKMSRDELKNYLEANGIGCGVHYPIPIHQQPMFRDLDYTDELPTSEQAAREVLSLPVHPSLTSHDLNTIAEVLKNA